MAPASSFDWSPYEGDRWTPEQIGDEISGTILELATAVGMNDKAHPVIKLDTDGGERTVNVTPVQLQGELAKVKPQEGDRLHVELVELRATGRPQPMKVFAVKHEPASGGDLDEEPF
jgi:hypothetical protein